MTLKQMIARVMRALPTLPPGTIGENDIIDLFNQGQLHLSRISAKMMEAEFSLDAEYSIIPLPLNLLTLDTVYWASTSINKELTPAIGKVPVDQPGDDQSDPTTYYTQGSRIAIRPIPGVNGTIKFVYVPKPVEMSNDIDTPDLEGSEQYLIAFALQRIHLEAGSPLLQLWDQEKAREEFTWIQTTDQNYRTPFSIDAHW